MGSNIEIQPALIAPIEKFATVRRVLMLFQHIH